MKRFSDPDSIVAGSTVIYNARKRKHGRSRLGRLGIIRILRLPVTGRLRRPPLRSLIKISTIFSRNAEQRIRLHSQRRGCDRKPENGFIDHTAGTFLVDGVGNFGGSSAWNMNNLTFGNGTGTETTTAHRRRRHHMGLPKTAAEANFWQSVTWSPELSLFCRRGSEWRQPG